MSRKSFLIILLLVISQFSFSQKTTYILPKSIDSENYNIRFDKVSSSTSSYFVNYKIENTANGILLIDRKKTSLEVTNGELYPTSDQYVLKPGDSKTVYNQFRIKAPAKANSDLLKLNLSGIRYASVSNTLKPEKFILKDGALQTFGDFQIKVMEYNVYSDRIYASVKCTYSGKQEELGKLELPLITVNGGEAEVVKKGDVIFPGKSYSFSINISPNGEETSIEFNKALQVMSVAKIDLGQIIIKSTSYIEPVEVDSVSTKPNTEKDTAATALNFGNLESLKKDIETEMNSGGKPVEMANEFLMENGPISVAQIIEIIAGFNLDGTRLKFAKMAYQYTSDKNKYHIIVGKLAYTKNKQALEEFLENQ